MMEDVARDGSDGDNGHDDVNRDEIDGDMSPLVMMIMKVMVIIW